MHGWLKTTGRGEPVNSPTGTLTPNILKKQSTCHLFFQFQPGGCKGVPTMSAVWKHTGSRTMSGRPLGCVANEHISTTIVRGAWHDRRSCSSGCLRNIDCAYTGLISISHPKRLAVPRLQGGHSAAIQLHDMWPVGTTSQSLVRQAGPALRLPGGRKRNEEMKPPIATGPARWHRGMPA